MNFPRGFYNGLNRWARGETAQGLSGVAPRARQASQAACQGKRGNSESDLIGLRKGESQSAQAARHSAVKGAAEKRKREAREIARRAQGVEGVQGRRATKMLNGVRPLAAAAENRRDDSRDSLGGSRKLVNL